MRQPPIRSSIRLIIAAAVAAVATTSLLAVPYASPPSAAAFCGSEDPPAYRGHLTDTTATSTAVATTADGNVFAYLSATDAEWATCDGYLYSGVAWNTSASAGTFEWGMLALLWGSQCDVEIGDYLAANGTASCPATPSQHALEVNLPAGTYTSDAAHDSVGDFSFVHSFCYDDYGTQPVREQESFDSLNADSRPGANCIYTDIDDTGTAQSISAGETRWEASAVETTVPRGSTKSVLLSLDVVGAVSGAHVEIDQALSTVVAPIGATDDLDLDSGGDYALSLIVEAELSTAVATYQGDIALVSATDVTIATIELTINVVDSVVNSVAAGVATPSSDRIAVNANGHRYVLDEVDVGLEKDLDLEDAEARSLELAEEYDALVIGSSQRGRMYQLRIPTVDSLAELEATRSALADEADVTFAALSYVNLEADAVPDDPWGNPLFLEWDEQNPAGNNWSMELIRAPSAWEEQTGDPSVGLAVIDWDLDPKHIDLQVSPEHHHAPGDRIPNNGHGTHVSGTACAIGNNDEGVTGMAWRCSLRMYQIGAIPDPANPGMTTPIDVTDLMVQAADDGARIVNMSLGAPVGPCRDLPADAAEAKVRDEVRAVYSDAINAVKANGHDVLWVMSAGNEECDAAWHAPGFGDEFDNVITVASVARDRAKSSFSNFGTAVGVAAPGGELVFIPPEVEDIYSTLSFSCWFVICAEYGFAHGTSQATPHVSGLAALVLSEHPGFTAAQLKSCIVTAAEEHGVPVDGHPFSIIDAPSAVACEGAEAGVSTDDAWKTLELSWLGGVTNVEPSGWKTEEFDDSAWSPAYIPPDPHFLWVDIPNADWLSSTGRATNHLNGEVWVARREFEISGEVDGDATLTWNVDNEAIIWVNGHQVASGGNHSQVFTATVPANVLQSGTNVIAAKVTSYEHTNDWGTNPTYVQLRVEVPVR